MLSFDMTYAWQDFAAHYEGQFDQGVTCVLGPSGGGKSTLLALLGGYITGQGHVLWQGAELCARQPFERPMTTLFQSDNVFPQLSVWQNIALGLTPSGRLTERQSARVEWALEQVQLSGYAAKYPDQLSGGQVQRVAVARVLVRDQPILLLDEPFSALDPTLRRDMLQLIKALTDAHQWTTVMITHAPEDARLLEARVMLIESGRVTANESIEALQGTALFEGYGKRKEETCP